MDDSKERTVLARFCSPNGTVLMGGTPEECIIRSRCPIMEGDKMEVMEIISEEEREFFSVTRTCKDEK